MALQAHPFQRTPELAKVGVHRQPCLARLLPPAHCPVNFLRLVPRQKGVTQQRCQVVGDGPGHSVLEVQNAGVAGGVARDHQVARHPVGVHGHHGLRQRAVDQQAAHPVPLLLFGRAPGDATFTLHTPGGEEVQLSAQQFFVKGRQRGAGHSLLKTQQGGQCVAHQRVGLGRGGGLQGLQVDLRAQVVEQQKTQFDVGFQHAGRGQACGMHEPCHVHKRAHVFQWRRCVHHDQAAACALHAQVAPETGVGRGGFQRVALYAVAGGEAGQPALKVGLAFSTGPGDLFVHESTTPRDRESHLPTSQLAKDPHG